MRKCTEVEIAVKVDSVEDLQNIGTAQCVYRTDNDFTEYFRNLYRRCVQSISLDKVSRIYYGSEFCEFCIPGLRDLEALLQTARWNNLNVTFLTPPVTNFGMEKIKNLLPLLAQYSCEISVNDFGVLQMLSDNNYTGAVICGRVLDKLYHDGRMNRTAFSLYTNHMGYDYLRSPAVSSPSFQSVLKRYGIMRYDIDLPQYGIDLDSSESDISFSTFLPYGYITTGRICMMRNVQKENFAGFDLTQRKCSQKCRQYDLLMIQPVSDIQLNSHGMRNRSTVIMRKGNTLFYGCTEIEPLELQQFDRIILQPKLML